MARQPAAYIQHEDEILEDIKLTPKQKKIAIEGIELDQQMKDLKKRIDALKNQIKESVGDDIRCNLIVPGVGSVSIVPKEEVVIADADRLSEIFDINFSNYVTEGTTYKATEALKDIVDDEDRPTHDMVMEAVTIKQSCSVGFKPEKK